MNVRTSNQQDGPALMSHGLPRWVKVTRVFVVSLQDYIAVVVGLAVYAGSIQVTCS